ncbi:hypothetical protein CVT25_011739 [Psilocybe cyanescens]|uniref:Uncharacterized protein n=1 Tax=Psilocybe cyanescens TaxID=93625 RepID=A0A409WIK1_PSICY|nr:hypothetical protein CVT25_011739 [Psilocybe cyanescens]
MISRGESRQYLKYTLSMARIKLLYEKITLTWFTSLYFFSALLACIVLSSLQIVSLVHDSEGVVNLSSVIAEYNRVSGIALLKGDAVELCSGLPDQTGTVCMDVISFKDSERELNVRDDLSDSDSDDDSSDSGDESDDDSDFSDDESGDEDDISNDKGENTASIITTSTALTVVSPTLSTSSILSAETTSSTSSTFSAEEGAVSATSSSSAFTIAPTTSSSSSTVTSTLTVVTTSLSSSTASSSIFSSITSTEISSSTTFIFLSTSSPPVSSTRSTTSTIGTTDNPKGTTIDPSGLSSVPGPSSARSEQASATAISYVPTATASPISSNDNSSELGDDCVISLTWLNDVYGSVYSHNTVLTSIHDTQREDVVIFIFQIWLFVLSFVTVLNESIPHLGAGLFGHILGTAWAGYRVYSIHGLMDRYRNHIVPDACNGRDFMGDWWENRTDDAIALVSLQAVALILVSYLSYKLFNVYASQTYKRVGASSQVHVIYKLVLLFSVCLQLSGFMSVASAAMWVEKFGHGPLSGLAKHAKLYLGAFIMTLMGWICVRRENRIKFAIFCLMSAFSFAISFATFYSDLYRFLLSTWPFFATMTITSFMLVVGTTILGVLCRLKFGRGLAQHLQHTEEKDDDSFSPVYFTNKGSLHDMEKFGAIYEPNNLPTVAIPGDGTHYIEFPIPVHASGPDTMISSTHVEPQMVPTSILSSHSVFSKALKRFSLRPPSPSVKSLRPELWTISNGNLPSDSIRSPLPTATSNSCLTLPAQQGMADAALPRMLVPPSPMETLSVYSFVTPRQTMTSEEMALKIRNGGLSSDSRQSLGSVNSLKLGLSAKSRQSTASVFSFTSGNIGASANPRESMISNISFTTRSVGFPENPRQSIASDNFSVKSRRVVGLPANPRSRMISTSQSYRA